MTTILGTLKKRADAIVRVVHNRLLRWTKPATRTPVRGAIADVAMTKAALVAENALLRQQLIVLHRQVKRPALMPRDRLGLVLLARLTRGWRSALLIVQPDTLLRWHRQGYRLVWRVRSATATKRPQVSEETVALIKRMATENRLWGAERIRGELLKLGMRVSKRTVQRHMRAARPPCPRRQTWATFLHNHAQDVWACDFLPVIDVGFRAIFAFFIVDLASHRVVHVGVTRHPTDAWVAQQLREATPFGAGPRFLIRDNDRKFGTQFARVAAGSRIEVLRTPVRAPRANAICERFLGSVRRECLDHLLILHENQLHRVLRAYCAYFNTARPHQGIGQAIPDVAEQVRALHASAALVSVPVLGGLHHDYQRAACPASPTLMRRMTTGARTGRGQTHPSRVSTRSCRRLNAREESLAVALSSTGGEHPGAMRERSIVWDLPWSVTPRPIRRRHSGHRPRKEVDHRHHVHPIAAC